MFPGEVGLSQLLQHSFPDGEDAQVAKLGVWAKSTEEVPLDCIDRESHVIDEETNKPALSVCLL